MSRGQEYIFFRERELTDSVFQVDPEKKKKKKKPTQVRVQPEAHAEDERAARDRNKDAIMYIHLVSRCA